MTAIKTDGGVLASVRATPVAVRCLLGGVLVNQLGAFVQTFMVLYLTVQGFSLAQAGAALTAYSAGAVAGTLIGGELTHRIGPRATITAAMATSAVVLGVAPLLSTPGLYAVLLVVMALAGMATQAYRPAAAVLLSDLMPDEHRVMAFSMMRTAMNAGAAAGPLLAAGLILLDWDLLFYFDAATALAFAVLARTLLPDAPAPRAEPDAPARASAYTALVRDRRFLLFLTAALVGSMVYVQYTVALPLKITGDGHSTTLYSVVLATASLVLILAELKVTSYVRHWPPHLAGAAGTVVMGLGVAGYGLSDSAVPLLATTVVFVAGIMISGPSMFAHPATYPVAVRARYVGAHQAAFGLGLAIGPTVGVLAWAGMGNAIWPVCGLACLVAAAFLLAGMRQPREMVGHSILNND
ncbi:MFS transporter [Actinokineospora sp. UTMC 2448]|uniref:MFS transporter n=1 Tax=Actinokineospora sp. UTMC 2448 TaxID=2268449 RepID=UPI002164720B|nr:MFS transporter [Actinokineospora sp. UTMC 2448]UVS80439.1 sn-glycerol-3-phosphate transporter [Actinokineospora sp. UTMC 2448]